METSRTKQLARRDRSSQAFEARASKMRDAIADRHGIKRPAVGGVIAPRQVRKRGDRGKNTRKSNTGSRVGSDGGSDTETSQSIDAKSDQSLYEKKDGPTPSCSSLGVEAKSDQSLYEKNDMPPSSFSSLDVDAKSDQSLYEKNDMLVNETSESAPDGQNHFLIEDEVDSVWNPGESTHSVVTQTQQWNATTQVVPQAVPTVGVGDDAVIVPRPESTSPLREYTPVYVKAYPTLKGKQYWSDEIPDPAFPVLQERHFKPPYSNWKGRYKNMFRHEGEAHLAKYNQFFESPAVVQYPEELITAKIGALAIRIKDLQSLGPQAWLNDNIIDLVTAMLSSIWTDFNEVKKAPVKVAVFDSRFATLIIEHPANSEPSCYNYTKVRSYAERRLGKRSPLSFERLIFPHNIGNSHWICIVVFPKLSLIVAIDSYRMGRTVAYARTIFRWLYDETKYNWPEDNTRMFGSHKPDRGWVFRVDNTVTQQNDTWNCGVFTLGYVICLLFEMNPNKLTPMLIADYRIRLFCDLFDEQVLQDKKRRAIYPPPPPGLAPTPERHQQESKSI
jgi:hypothetical protein